jgi:hypothetical protein
MGATNIHYEAPKSKFKSAREAYKALVEEETLSNGTDPYNGTISTCRYVGEIGRPDGQDEYDRILDYRITETGYCAHYETEKYYVFVGWART